MLQPVGHKIQGSLRKSTTRKGYSSLKQSPRALFDKFSTIVAHYRLATKLDHFIFVRHSPSSIIVLVVYVDDIIVIGDNHQGIFQLEPYLVLILYEGSWIVACYIGSIGLLLYLEVL